MAEVIEDENHCGEQDEAEGHERYETGASRRCRSLLITPPASHRSFMALCFIRLATTTLVVWLADAI